MKWLRFVKHQCQGEISIKLFCESFDEINGDGAMMDDNMKSPKKKLKSMMK